VTIAFSLETLNHSAIQMIGAVGPKEECQTRSICLRNGGKLEVRSGYYSNLAGFEACSFPVAFTQQNGDLLREFKQCLLI